MAPLTAGTVEHTRTSRQLEHVEQSRNLPPILDEVEDRLVLVQVLRVELRLPPRRGRRRPGTRTQKNTGSR